MAPSRLVIKLKQLREQLLKSLCKQIISPSSEWRGHGTTFRVPFLSLYILEVCVVWFWEAALVNDNSYPTANKPCSIYPGAGEEIHAVYTSLRIELLVSCSH